MNSAAKIGLFLEFAKLNPPVPPEDAVYLLNRFGTVPVRLVGENEVEKVLFGEAAFKDVEASVIARVVNFLRPVGVAFDEPAVAVVGVRNVGGDMARMGFGARSGADYGVAEQGLVPGDELLCRGVDAAVGLGLEEGALPRLYPWAMAGMSRPGSK